MAKKSVVGGVLAGAVFALTPAVSAAQVRGAPANQIGRYEISNGTPSDPKSIMRIDTMTGATWIACWNELNEHDAAWCKMTMRQPLEAGVVGRYHIVNATPTIAANTMLLDTMTGKSWITCPGTDGLPGWCSIALRQHKGAPSVRDDLPPLPVPKPVTPPAPTVPSVDNEKGKGGKNSAPALADDFDLVKPAVVARIGGEHAVLDDDPYADEAKKATLEDPFGP
jgi:hypothetical protein